MKKLTTMIMAITLMFGFGVCLVGCDTEITITSISIKSGTLDTEYYVNDEFSVENAVLVVSYSDGSTEEYTSADLNFASVFDTISTATAGTKSLHFTYGGRTVTLKIKVFSSLEDTYDVTGFEAPAFVTNYNYYKNEKNINEKETEFYNRTAEYKVGDDNAFIFLPRITALDEENHLITPSAYRSNVIVELKNAETSEFSILTGEDLTNMVSVDTEKSSFDFTETAIGETFKITVRPEFVEVEDLQDGAISFTFTVVDGWNAYDASDLSRINNNTTTELAWADYKNANSISNDPINALVLHNDISITSSDIPVDYVWQESEVFGAADYEISLGSLKDNIAIYTRMVGINDSFTLSGNYFTIDASTIPLIVRNDNIPLPSNEFNQGLIPNSLIFGFSGDKAGTDVAVANGRCVMENLNVVGNSNRSENVRNLGGLTMVNSTSNDFIADNVISKCFLTNYTTQRSGADGSDAKTTLNNCKTYDSFSCMLYLHGCETNNITNSEFKRAGGPIALVCAVDNGTNHANVNFADCIIENYVTGQETWFNINGASGKVSDIAALDAVVKGYSGNTKSITNSEGKINFITAMIDATAPFSFEYALQGTTTINYEEELNDTILDMNAFNTNSSLTTPCIPTETGTISLIDAGFPFFQSSAGGLGFYNGSIMQELINIPAENNGLYQGDYMYLFLKGASQYIGACVEYFDTIPA